MEWCRNKLSLTEESIDVPKYQLTKVTGALMPLDTEDITVKKRATLFLV